MVLNLWRWHPHKWPYGGLCNISVSLCCASAHGKSEAVLYLRNVLKTCTACCNTARKRAPVCTVHLKLSAGYFVLTHLDLHVPHLYFSLVVTPARVTAGASTPHDTVHTFCVS